MSFYSLEGKKDYIDQSMLATPLSMSALALFPQGKQLTNKLTGNMLISDGVLTQEKLHLSVDPKGKTPCLLHHVLSSASTIMCLCWQGSCNAGAEYLGQFGSDRGVYTLD